MAERTKIQWTHHTFNPWWGCTHHGPECLHCYAETMSHRLGFQVWGNDAPRRFFGDEHWANLDRWNRRAQKAGERRRVFVASMADVAEVLPRNHPQREAMDMARARLCQVITRTPFLDYLLLTKRPHNVMDVVPAEWRGAWPFNAWVGTSIGAGASLARLDDLLRIPAPVRFVSMEPLLEHVLLRCGGCGHPIEVCRGAHSSPDGGGCSGLWPDWVICGGESGHYARPFDLEWARALRDQCAAATVPFFFKQTGANPVDGGVPLLPPADLQRNGPDEMAMIPPDLRVRQFPEVRS